MDDTGALDATYFNQPYRKNSLHAGETYIFYGKVEANGFRKTMTNPVCEQAARCGSVTNCFYPVYPLTTGVTQNDIRKAMTPALHACIGQMQDVIPADIARAYRLAQQDYALQNIHQPADAQALDTRAQAAGVRGAVRALDRHGAHPLAAARRGRHPYAKCRSRDILRARSPSRPPGRSGAPSLLPCRT
ncbi:MAG: hypothetical protein ACLUNO_00685 [Oscillospiraceae bacterium]